MEVDESPLHVYFDSQRLDQYRDRVEDIRKELPEKFNSGAPWHEIGFDRNGNKWTAFRRRMQYIRLLLIGIGKAKLYFDKKKNEHCLIFVF